MASDEPQVTYSTKELLAEIKRQVENIANALIAKADYSAVVELDARLDRQDARIHTLEQSDAIYSAQARDRKYLYGALLTLISVLVGVGGLLLAFLTR